MDGGGRQRGEQNGGKEGRKGSGGERGREGIGGSWVGGEGNGGEEEKWRMVEREDPVINSQTCFTLQ